MTNRIALVLAAILGLLIVADVWANGAATLLFLAKKLFAFSDYIAFWR